jgi:hypothetical protein
MMWIPPNLYPLLDRLRTLADRSPHNGALKAQDDQGAPLLAELPIDALRRGLDAIGFELIDLRQEPREGRGAAIGTRKVTKCTALLWHQTAALVSLHQATGIPAHALILERAVVLLHPLRAYVQHAGAGNAFTIGSRDPLPRRGHRRRQAHDVEIPQRDRGRDEGDRSRARGDWRSA